MKIPLLPPRPHLLTEDRWGYHVINKDYNAAMLAEALCKLEGFTYAPRDSVCWQHRHSTECDVIYVTTANLNRDQLRQLGDEVGPDRTPLYWHRLPRTGPMGFRI